MKEASSNRWLYRFKYLSAGIGSALAWITLALPFVDTPDSDRRQAVIAALLLMAAALYAFFVLARRARRQVPHINWAGWRIPANVLAFFIAVFTVTYAMAAIAISIALFI